MELPLLSEDRTFIQQRLKKVPFNIRPHIMANYATIWKEAADSESDINKKDNAGRRAANSYLMRYLDSDSKNT